MIKCWYSKKTRVICSLCCILFLVCATIILIGLSGCSTVSVWILWGWLAAFGLIALAIWNCLIFLARSYQVTEKVFELKNFKKKVLQYSWEEISEISVCDVHHATKSYVHDKVIRVVLAPEKNGPTNPKCSRHVGTGLERWRDYSYSLKNYRKIILIEYSEERLNQIQEVYKKEIKDYRTKRWNQYNG